MVKFTTYDEIKSSYDTQKFDIFFEKGGKKYEVRHIGSTIYCHDTEKNLGMGAINNFDVDGFYAIERPEPEPVPEESEETES